MSEKNVTEALKSDNASDLMEWLEGWIGASGSLSTMRTIARGLPWGPRSSTHQKVRRIIELIDEVQHDLHADAESIKTRLLQVLQK